ncbi:MAG: FliG C-terminal domain-containing protein [Candidatus Omnitrophota bacterium]
MKTTRKLFYSTLPLKAAFSVLVCSLAILPPAAAAQRRADEAILESDMATRLESMVEKVVGKERSIVKVKVTLSRPQAEAPLGSLRGKLGDMPGVAFSKAEPKKEETVKLSVGPTIEKIAITIFLDNKIASDKIDSIKESIPRWMDLDFERGDTLKIELKPWKELPPEDIAIKQLSFLKGNLLAIVAIASIVILVFVLMAVLAVPARKMIKQRLKMPSDEKKLKDLAKVMGDLKNVIIKSTAGAAKNVDTLLEDIKGILARAPSRSDGLLEEIRDVLENIATKSMKGGEGGSGGAGGSAGSAAGLQAPEFLQALRDTLAPMGGDGGLSPEALQVLQSIEEHIKRQVDGVAAGDILDEPFKYLNSISTGEISLYIDGEEPRIAAIILGHIDPNKAAEVVAELSDERKIEVSVAMATLVETDKVAAEIKDFIRRKMPEVKLRSDFQPITGSKALAELLSSSTLDITNYVLDNLQKSNPSIAEAVKKEMFLFEDIAGLQNEGVAELLKSTDRHRLSLALLKASDAVKTKFFNNMTERAVAMVKEEMSALQPVSDEGLKDEILFFEDIVNLGQKRFQQIFSNIDRNMIKLALKGSSEEVRTRVFAVMTERGAAMLREDIEVMPNIARERTLEAQKEILDYVRKLEMEPIVAQQEIIAKVRELERAGRLSLGSRS